MTPTCWSVVGLVVLATPLAAQATRPALFDRDSHFVQLDRHATISARVRTICASEHARDYAALITEQGAFVDSVSRPAAPTSAWIGLACRRALLFAMGAPGREGPLMLPGTSWVSAAVDEALKALTRDPANLQAAELLGAIGFEVVPARIPAGEEREAVGSRTAVAVPPAIVPRLASQIYRAVQLGVHDPAVLRACTSLLLDAGDAGTAHDCSMRALALGSDSTWHLLRITWLAALQHDTAGAKRAFAAAVRAAHDAESRAEIGWHLESPCQPQDACAPMGVLAFRLPAADKGAWLTLPDSAAGAWLATTLDAAGDDDIDVLRHGFHGWNQADSPLRGAESWSALARRLMGHFMGVSYAGATFRSCLVFGIPEPPCWGVLDPYDNAPLQVIAQVDHLWDPATGSPVDLLPYTIFGNDLATQSIAGGRAASVDLAYRRWGARGVRDSVFTLSLMLSPHGAKASAFTGLVVTPALPGMAGWSLLATQVELRHGGVYQDSKEPLDSGDFAISDLVIGVASQRLSWESGSRKIALAPQGVVRRTEPVQFYFQVKSATEHPAARLKLSVFPYGSDHATTIPAMQVAFDVPIRAGVNEIEHDLALSRLGTGRYSFEMEVTDSASRLVSRRSVLMYLQ